MESPTGDDWLRDAWRTTSTEIQLYARTLRDFFLHPMRFGERMRAGERLMNPFAYMAISLAVMTPAAFLIDIYFHPKAEASEHSPNWLSLLEPIREYLVAAVWAAGSHVAMRMMGSARAMHETLALLFYQSGPRALAGWLLFLFVALGGAKAHYTTKWVTFDIVLGILLIVPMTLAMARLHGVRLWRALLVSLWPLVVAVALLLIGKALNR